ncbi:hypothetical protein SAMN04488029_2890 [Reichenbachiella faecimaris]|uniref:Uncharacterized protein n=1 Tax=Reichenbachiella faecimaris TaxID=692418 RepID=A0A1W2GIE3_REIFA|nr:hypothetical protein [Reichenbachiella faecimaris]SMD36420.1 hypothetical protein SAMN04488029_2890 [Reichenbachiella faecimaris]
MSDSLASCTTLITKHFQLPDEELAPHQSSEQALEDALASIINNLINQDMTRLMNAFYKIDLDEVKFKKILTTAAPDQIGITLAREVIKREMQKVKTREQYRNF